MITVDTNILVYVVDAREPPKQSTSIAVLNRLAQMPPEDAAVGLQAIGELHSALHRRLRRPVWEAARIARNMLTSFNSIFAPTEAAVQDALGSAATGQLNYWDALLLASARDAGCTSMLSEDMQDGARLLSIRIINPFDADGGLSSTAREALHL